LEEDQLTGTGSFQIDIFSVQGWAAKTLLLKRKIGVCYRFDFVHRGERLKPGLQRWSPGFSRSPRASLSQVKNKI